MICPRPSGVVATDPSPMAPPARPAPISSLIADEGRDRDLVYRLRTIGLHYHAMVNARFLCHHEAYWQAAPCFLFRRPGNRGISMGAHVRSEKARVGQE